MDQAAKICQCYNCHKHGHIAKILQGQEDNLKKIKYTAAAVSTPMDKVTEAVDINTNRAWCSENEKWVFKDGGCDICFMLAIW